MTDKQWEKEFDRRCCEWQNKFNNKGGWRIGIINEQLPKCNLDKMKDFISKTISQEVEKERERIEKCIPKEVKGRIRAWRCGSDADYVSGYNLALKEIRKDFPKE